MHSRWIVYHSNAWGELVEQGFYTALIEEFNGVRWAFMVPYTWRGFDSTGNDALSIRHS
jgi:hypothetical protein